MKKILLASALVLSFVSNASSVHASASSIVSNGLNMIKTKASSDALCDAGTSTLRGFEGVICNLTEPTVNKSSTSAPAKALKQALALIVKQADAEALSAITVGICKGKKGFDTSTCGTKAKAFLGEDGFNDPGKVLLKNKDAVSPAIKVAICSGPHKNKAPEGFCGKAGVGAGAAVSAPQAGVGVR